MRKTQKRVLFVLFLCILTVSANALFASQWDSRVDPALRRFLDDAIQSSAQGSTVKGLHEGGDYGSMWAPIGDDGRIDVLVKLARKFEGTRLGSLAVTASTGTILGLSATVEQILELLQLDDVVYIEPSRRTVPTLDESVALVHANLLHAATPSVTGAGVVVGALDTGIDYSHLDFRVDRDGDGFEESSRILSILDQTFGFFGTEYSQQEIETDLANSHGPNQGLVRQADTDGHGTHVMSIAAGDGSSSATGMVGVAPDAWIVMVKTTYFTSDILQGVAHIFDLADALGVPAVVNLSLGGHEGPHDGTSLFEQGMDELIDGAGRVIVVSAGNEGDQSIHASEQLLGNTSSFRLRVDGWDAELDLWYPGASQFSIAVTPPSGSTIHAPWRTDTGVVQTPFGVVRVDNASLGANPNNGDNDVYIRFSGLSGGGTWQISVTDTGGNGGKYDAWIISGSATILDGDSSSTIDEPGNAHEVITVGSFNSKAQWPSLSGDQNYSSSYPVGVLSDFSSQGPTRDGRRKPDLCAPGAWIGAALSDDALWQGYLVHPDGVHTMELGTSMAAPHVAGAAALLLSVNPELAADDIRVLLRETATRDNYTGPVPNDRWGWGKLDVAAAIAEVEQPAPPPVDPPDPPTAGAPTLALLENPVESMARFIIDLPLAAASVEIHIYASSGALVYDAGLNPGSEHFDWPLITNRGDSLASGLYLAVLVTDQGVSDVQKLVIAR